MKRFLIMSFCLLSPLTGQAQTKQKSATNAFRLFKKIKLGDDEDKTLKVLGKLGNKRRIKGHKTFCHATFKVLKTTKVECTVYPKKPTPAKLNLVYQQLIKHYTKQFGPPRGRGIVYKNREWYVAANKSKRNMRKAIEKGVLTKFAFWKRGSQTLVLYPALGWNFISLKLTRTPREQDFSSGSHLQRNKFACISNQHGQRCAPYNPEPDYGGEDMHDNSHLEHIEDQLELIPKPAKPEKKGMSTQMKNALDALKKENPKKAK